MRYVSLFSGIEAASVAWAHMDWEPVAFAEIEPFPCAVLQERFPDVPNLGDVTKVDWRDFVDRYGAVDLVVGGSPCQSFSIAGNRGGGRGIRPHVGVRSSGTGARSSLAAVGKRPWSALEPHTGRCQGRQLQVPAVRAG